MRPTHLSFFPSLAPVARQAPRPCFPYVSSAWNPLAAITGAQRARSAAMRARSMSGVPPVGSSPSGCSRARTSGARSAAVRRGTAFDYGLMGVSVTGASMPIFWWGLMVILVFSVALGWTPVSGRIGDMFYIEPWSGFMLIDSWYSDDKGAFKSVVQHLILPTIVLGTVPLATIARMTRSSMLEVLGEDFIRTARAKGLSPVRVVVVHALRNALIPVVTVIGLQMGGLMGGAILTETIFAWPGIGHWLVEAIQRRDYPVLQGGTLLIAVLVMAVNLGVDVTYGFLNPRIRR